MRRILEQAGQAVPDSKPSLELNPEHPLVEKLEAEVDEDDAPADEEALPSIVPREPGERRTLTIRRTLRSGTVVRFDGDLLNAYRYLHFYIRGDAHQNFEVGVLLETNANPNSVVVDSTRNPNDALVHEVAVPKEKWVEVRVDLWDPKVKREDWGEVYGIRLGLIEAGGETPTLHIDSIRLEKP